MRSPQRTPPTWFAKALRAIDHRLRVRWLPAQRRWMITERVPGAVFCGLLGSVPLYRVSQQEQRVVFCEELGSRVLDWVRRVDMSRFQTQDDMIKRLNVDESDHKPTASFA